MRHRCFLHISTYNWVQVWWKRFNKIKEILHFIFNVTVEARLSDVWEEGKNKIVRGPRKKATIGAGAYLFNTNSTLFYSRNLLILFVMYFLLVWVFVVERLQLSGENIHSVDCPISVSLSRSSDFVRRLQQQSLIWLYLLYSLQWQYHIQAAWPFTSNRAYQCWKWVVRTAHVWKKYLCQRLKLWLIDAISEGSRLQRCW